MKHIATTVLLFASNLVFGQFAVPTPGTRAATAGYGQPNLVREQNLILRISVNNQRYTDYGQYPATDFGRLQCEQALRNTVNGYHRSRTPATGMCVPDVQLNHECGCFTQN